jgi:histone acetyltransferase (RNA polymerase elongator complex component)
MKISELLKEEIEKLPKGEASAMYWARRFEEENFHDEKVENHSELEAALLDNVPHKWAKIEDHRIAAAISFSEDEAIHISHFGSILPGAGAELLTAVERFAKRKKKNVTLVSSKIAASYYEKRGYKRTSDKHSTLLIKQI